MNELHNISLKISENYSDFISLTLDTNSQELTVLFTTDSICEPNIIETDILSIIDILFSNHSKQPSLIGIECSNGVTHAVSEAKFEMLQSANYLTPISILFTDSYSAVIKNVNRVIIPSECLPNIFKMQGITCYYNNNNENVLNDVTIYVNSAKVIEIFTNADENVILKTYNTDVVIENNSKETNKVLQKLINKIDGVMFISEDNTMSKLVPKQHVVTYRQFILK